MQLEDFFQNVRVFDTMWLNENFRSEVNKAIEEFKKDYKIVNKEQWCVTISDIGNGHNVSVQGPFDHEQYAIWFANIWNKKREEFCDKLVEENNDEDILIPYLFAKVQKLEVSEKNNDIIDEIIKIMKGES